MAAKTVKLAALPAALGFASVRVYALTEIKAEELLSPQELSVYTPLPRQLHYVEEDPGLLQRGLGVARVGLLPYVRAVKRACVTIKIGAVNLYHAGVDTYEFLKDPPPGFLPRVSVITVSGLAGLILARRGSRMKRIGVPLGLATMGTAVCYPAQTVGVLKLSGKKAYSATQWASSSVTSLWKSSPAPPASPESVPAPASEPEATPPKPVPEADSAPPPVDEPVSSPLPEAASAEETLSVPVPVPEGDAATAEEPAPLLASEAQSTAAPVEDSVPEPVPAAEPTSQPAAPEPVPAESQAGSPPAVILSVDTPAEVPEKPRFAPDPKLMDHGQSNPEDADLYSTRS
ncbi:MICOS complex subunit MIC27-like isoform X2 [Megalops cyprinoides]|uniref:MICOS complex subunit MIC27-like isoform X2 n=1 Tax=Megalops cyprinoides TaxID=118141 RepID=UPI0018649426|nr:MICOS complex subunit MIC27-like isoform X2 [Megalops cyprinoides]